ncbi:hypothetical protein [Amycolatopsis cihanbeyliensis]|uniref:hypothetical protein n=1 Tax=Amycolatopsis cihanbeyliensis TaxID=1128664 RepID=UPI0011507DE5|nr:hypothetical protein [Amycolatopsis cihanbeyliensis]
MHDLVVTARPVPEYPRVEVVVVRSPSSGYDDRIRRTSEAAVPLFWRFMIEKFSVAPARPEATGHHA